MAESILQSRADCQCYACLHLDGDASTKRGLEEHHVLHGAYRPLAEQHGLKVMLCRKHHTGDASGSRWAVHGNAEIDRWLKARAQLAWMEHRMRGGESFDAARAAWLDTFGKSWI